MPVEAAAEKITSRNYSAPTKTFNVAVLWTNVELYFA
jgi:hypothetical protein